MSNQNKNNPVRQKAKTIISHCTVNQKYDPFNRLKVNKFTSISFFASAHNTTFTISTYQYSILQVQSQYFH